MNKTPAFPTRISNQTFFGMTLRDWFAGQYMQGGLAREYYPCDELAQNAYKYADAMLSEREKNHE